MTDWRQVALRNNRDPYRAVFAPQGIGLEEHDVAGKDLTPEERARLRAGAHA